MTLQELIDSQGGAVRLSPDEYEGPLVIHHPCTIDGAGSTVWCAQGPVVTVRADNVVLDNLRIELTGQNGDQCALLCERPGTVLRHVEVYGLACGCAFPAEPLSVPRTVDLGVFAAEERNVFVQPLTLPAPARVRADLAGIAIEPHELPAGTSDLRITTGELRGGTSVYGEIFLDGPVVRRIYLRGRAEKGAPVHAAGSSAAPRPQRVAAGHPAEAAVLRKGERRGLDPAADVEIRLQGAGSLTDIDCYVFCLGSDGKVRDDSGLVFFGQRRSPDGAVRILDGVPGALISPAAAEADTARIVVAFSAYQGVFPAGATGAPEVRVAAGSDAFLYPLTGCGGIRTVTALHLYRRGDGWRLWCTDHRSREGIEALCAEYGVEVE